MGSTKSPICRNARPWRAGSSRPRARPQCVVVVTCRFAGYGGARLGADFLELHLRPLSREQSEAFIANWYRIVETALNPSPDPSAGEALARTRATELIERLRAPDYRAARLVTMTRNPLLLANLCLVHRDRGTLPTGRARLYSECIDVLLEHWRQSKGLSVDVTAEAGRRALQPVALWLHTQEGRVRASAEELAPVLEPALGTVQYKGGGATDFLRTVRDASGLLTGWGQDQYGFMHLGFQEYLAASELRRRVLEGDASAVQILADGYSQSWWQEVILILVALGNPSAFVPFMREVVQRKAFVQHRQLLALIFEDASEVSEEPFVELIGLSGEGPGLFERQLVALQVLGRYFSREYAGVSGLLRHHPLLAGIQSWPLPHSMTSAGVEDREVIVTKNGEVELVPIPGGTFTMGSPQSEVHRLENEGPQHTMIVPAFYLGRYPVTNEEYGRFLRANPSEPEPGHWAIRHLSQARQPVVAVSWEQAQRFAQWAGCRLPTEAEWEYACRAGVEASRYGELNDIAWSHGNSGKQSHPVGEKLANAFGLHDMLGNVWEWCLDSFSPYLRGPVVDPSGTVGAARVIRGGAWDHPASHTRAARRVAYRADSSRSVIGFRVARDLRVP
jgi:formylglycine-generating enzyme required for sulfatase activity